MGDEISGVALGVLNNGTPLDSINATNIALIPWGMRFQGLFLGVLFSKNVGGTDAQNLRSVLGMSRSLERDPYLGLPMAFGRARSNEFRTLVQKVQNRVHQWSSQFLSHRVKVVLIKASVQVILVFTMSCFLLPKKVVHELDRLVVGYW